MVFRKILELPALGSAEEYRQVIRAQAADYLPDSIENVQLDYQILSQAPDADNNQQVMVAAVGKRTIEDLLAVFKTAKLNLQGVDPKPSAVGRAIVAPQEKGSFILVDIGSENTSVSVYEEHKVWITGTVNLGGNLFRTPEGETVDADKHSINLKQLSSNILDEIDHVLKFYANRTAKQSMPKEIRLAGSGAVIEGITMALGKGVRQKVTIGKPIIAVPEGFTSNFYGALGSALYPLYELI